MTSQKGYGSYQFSYKLIDKSHFQLFAKPIKLGLKTIFVDESQVFHVNNKEGVIIDYDKETAPARRTGSDLRK